MLQQQSKVITPGFITPEGLKTLDNYKYTPGKYTKLDNLMNYYWEWVIKMVPTTVAPNMITLLGWLCVILSYSIILVYDWTMEGDIPNWCFITIAIGIFLYSTLDAIDGKQARRTKSSSPLGQLFDHGCDSFTMTFFILSMGQAGKLSSDIIMLFLISMQLAFLTANWMQYHSGILRTNIGQFGITEAQFIIIFLIMLTGIVGQNFWLTFTLQNIVDFIGIGGIVGKFISAEYLSYQFSTVGIKVFSYGSLIAFVIQYATFIWKLNYTFAKKIMVVLQYTSIWAILIMQWIWSTFSIYNEFEALILINFGVAISLIACKIIISSVTKMKLSILHTEIIIPMILTIILSVLELQGDYHSMKAVFLIGFFINIAMTFKFVFGVIHQITKYLGIYCFSLKKRTKIKIDNKKEV